MMKIVCSFITKNIQKDRSLNHSKDQEIFKWNLTGGFSLSKLTIRSRAISNPVLIETIYFAVNTELDLNY